MALWICQLLGIDGLYIFFTFYESLTFYDVIFDVMHVAFWKNNVFYVAHFDLS